MGAFTSVEQAPEGLEVWLDGTRLSTLNIRGFLQEISLESN